MGAGPTNADAKVTIIGTKPDPALAHARLAPKLLSVWRDGYSGAQFRSDALAGLTVAIVALPLSMAIAIASGASPEAGLYTAIVGGFLISLLGGSRHQIGGPAGAFIVLVAATIEKHGFDGLLLATAMAGAMMFMLGMLKLGSLIRFIPNPVIIGFTTAIGIIIFASQIKDLLGLVPAVKEPAALFPKLSVLLPALPTLNPSAFAIAAGTIAIILGLRRLQPRWPGLLIAVVVASVAALSLNLPVETIGSRFGGVPSGLPAPVVPDFSLAKMQAVLPAAIAIALLGAIESLLSAVVADGMAGRQHRPNTELVAQGVANIATAFFGGITATGTLARTATNIRAGAHGPVSGMLHAIYLLGFMLLAAPLLVIIPLAALAGILAVVAWNMIEPHAIRALSERRADLIVFGSTFLITIFRDLLEGIIIGLVLHALIIAARRFGSRA
jgi:SulP family sulfate permease